MFSTSIGKKIWMAISGILMLLFVALHMVGNSMNPYALGLPDLGKLMLVIKVILLVLLLIHALLGIQVTIENKTATNGSYAVKKNLKTTFAAETMIWSGLLILCFLVVHLLQFRFSVLPGPGFDQVPFLIVYAVAFISLFLHLYHGIGSFFQTMGWNTACNKPAIETTGKVISLILLVGLVAIVLLNR